MNHSQVIALLEANQNQPYVERWNERDVKQGRLKSLGIGLTVLRKLAKQIGRDHALALELWDSDLYDARIIALLIDDPKQITREQAEMQVEHLEQGHLAHVFSSCNASLAKTSFVVELMLAWVHSKDAVRRRCGYGLLYEISKSKKKSAPDDSFFLERIEHINATYTEEDGLVLAAMGGALMGIGKRNPMLNAAALKVAKSIGPIPIKSKGRDCEPFNVVKHLTSDYIRTKLGV